MFFDLPRSICVTNQSTINGLIIGNLLIFIAYCLIPLLIFKVSRGVKSSGLEMPEHKISRLFKAFIFSCGCTHLMGAIVFFYPVFRLENFFVWVTAIVSLSTCYLLYLEVPTIIKNIAGSARLSISGTELTNILDEHDKNGKI